MPNSDSIDDIQCDLAAWERELERLENAEEPDEEAITECQKHIRTLQDTINELEEI